MKDLLVKLIKTPIVLNLVVAAVISVVLAVGVLKWLDVYTRHNQAIVVPDLKGMDLDEATYHLEQQQLQYNVIDSVFSQDVNPGSVVEVVPKAGSKVKAGRIVFITINARTAQMALIPEVADLSFRQAYALLKSRGFDTIETEYVPGDYKDLAIAVTLRGDTLHPGVNVPLSVPLTLIVSNGMAEPDSLAIDSLQVEPLDSEEEKWF
jgi:hypothetical protein